LKIVNAGDVDAVVGEDGIRVIAYIEEDFGYSGRFKQGLQRRSRVSGVLCEVFRGCCGRGGRG
jgi:hypothetical protein